MGTHDPRKVVEDLRDQLVRHDKPLAFLFGAGTSCCVNLAAEPEPGKKRGYEPLAPDVATLTEMCRSVVCTNNDRTSAWTAAQKECKDAGVDPNIEALLSLVRRKIGAMSDADRLLGLNRKALQELDDAICSEITKAVDPGPDRIPLDLPHHRLAHWIRLATRDKPVEIFTVNYDLLVELALEKAHIPYFDGFVGSREPFFHAESMGREERGAGRSLARLWKIHGSINWRLSRSEEGSVRVVRALPGESSSLIMPSHHKYHQSRKQPYLALLDHLRAFLEQDDALLVTAGYSFGDQHINGALFGALETRPSAHVAALIYGDVDQADSLAGKGKGLRNLMVLGANAAVLAGAWGKWRLTEPVNNAWAGLMDVAFDSHADIDNHNPHDGKFTLGDFNKLCQFLDALTPDASGGSR